VISAGSESGAIVTTTLAASGALILLLVLRTLLRVISDLTDLTLGTNTRNLTRQIGVALALPTIAVVSSSQSQNDGPVATILELAILIVGECTGGLRYINSAEQALAAGVTATTAAVTSVLLSTSAATATAATSSATSSASTTTSAASAATSAATAAASAAAGAELGDLPGLSFLVLDLDRGAPARDLRGEVT